MDYGNDTINSVSFRELPSDINNHFDPIRRSSSLSPTRTFAWPLMGTSARAAKRRLDGDTGPIRIDGTDIYNQQLRNHYQNVRHIVEDQHPSSISNVHQSNESGQSFNTKRDFIEQHFESSPLPYNSPPQEIITTITTTTSTTPTQLNHANLSLNQSSPSIDRLLEQAAEFQKLNNNNSNKDSSQQSLVIEHTEQYQVYLDRANHEAHHSSPISLSQRVYATDLDQAQAQVDRLTDDHQAIRQLTRVLQEHNTASPPTTNQYKRLSSQISPVLINTTTTTTTTIPTDITLVDRNKKTMTSEFSVIDALLDNPLGTNNSKQNDTLHARFNNILSSLQNAVSVNVLRQSITRDPRKNKTQTQTQLTQTIFSEQTPLLNSKEQKKQDKENKKKNKTKKVSKKKKSKKVPDNTNYQVIDAIIDNPISVPVPDTYLRKYTVGPLVSQLSFGPSIITRDNMTPFYKQPATTGKNETGYGLVKVVNELMLHHAAALPASVPTTTNGLQQTTKPTYLNNIAYQPRPTRNFNQSETPIKPRILYRYIDEQGNVLKLSSTPPSQLQQINPEKQSQQNSYRNIEPTYFHSRQIVTDNNHRHQFPKREGRTPWQDESKIPKTTTREELELRDKHRSQLSEQSFITTRAIPVSIEHEHSIRTPSHQQQQYHNPNQQNVKLTWLPLSHQLDEPYIQSSTAGYDTDSTNSDHSAAYRTYDYAPIGPRSHSNNRPLYRQDHYHNRSPNRNYYPSPRPLSYGGGREISPDYNANGLSRNYIEVFRDGATKPSEIYSLPLLEPGITSHRHSRYDKHQAEKSGKHHSLLFSKHDKNIPSSSSHGEPYYPYAVQNSPNHDSTQFDAYLHESKSSEYRPLRTKLQREYKITPNLLVDEWDHPEQSISPDYTKLSSISSPDDVFITNSRSNKA